MVRFSCFPSHKKSVHLSAEAIYKSEGDCSQSLASNNRTYMSMTNTARFNMEGDTSDNRGDHVIDPSPIEHDWKCEEIERKSYTESDIGVDKTARMKKTMSLGSGLDYKGKLSDGNESEAEMDQKFSCNGSISQCELDNLGSSKDFKVCRPDHFQEALPSNSLQGNSELVNIESIFSIEDPQQPGKEGQDNSDHPLSGAGISDDHSPHTPIIVKSSSLPDIHSPLRDATRYLRCSRSDEDLNILDSRRKEMSTYELGKQVIQHERDDTALDNEKSNREFAADDGYGAYNYVGSSKDWIVPTGDEDISNFNHQEQSSFSRWNDLPSKDFKIKRIEEWVMELQRYSPPLGETTELSPSIDHEMPEDGYILESPAAKLDVKVNPSMESVKKYISSLSLASTAAQLVNHGLVVIPFLSAFTSLRTLNLSGNAIVRITAGSLPRGLHVLNLSKNSISTIEGLRELTRLRVLDLSYNRILRIGHGLASCPSLKELYLAGNKISEVEGLHRLLKLNVLDLRFNKISTTKCLGQLAANYNSLQAISLEGNPAQKNIGDEHLRKYLQGLLPHLAYYNRQTIKVGTLKDAADRSARVGINSHQMERSLRAELKTIRKGTLGVAAQKASSSSIHGRKSQAVASSKTSRTRNGRLPPTGTKINTDRHHIYDFSNKLLNFGHLSIRRSRSEGTLAAAL